MSKCSKSAAPTDGAGAPEIEIAITTEMVEAGVGALVSYDTRVMSEEEGVEQIYRAMASKAPRSTLRTPR